MVSRSTRHCMPQETKKEERNASITIHQSIGSPSKKSTTTTATPIKEKISPIVFTSIYRKSRECVHVRFFWGIQKTGGKGKVRTFEHSRRFSLHTCPAVRRETDRASHRRTYRGEDRKVHTMKMRCDHFSLLPRPGTLQRFIFYPCQNQRRQYRGR